MRKSGRSAGGGEGGREDATMQEEVPSRTDQVTRCLRVDGIEGRVPRTDVEQGLRGLFGVFGEVEMVKLLQPEGSPAATRSSPSSRTSHERQAVIAYKSRDAARQAIARLQGFAIWGKPLLLSFCGETKGEEEGEESKKQAIKYPKSAPPKRQDGVGEEISDRMKSVKRNMMNEFEGKSPEPSREMSASLPHKKFAADYEHGGESAIDRLDRLMLERLIQDANSLHSRGEVKDGRRSGVDLADLNANAREPRRFEGSQSASQQGEAASSPIFLLHLIANSRCRCCKAKS